MRKGTIGVFDSGLGGLLMLRSLVRKLPQYDYVYLGDTKRVPYGNRSHATIYRFLKQAVEFLFSQGCELIIVACNTASASALRRIQQEYLPKHYPDKRVLGVIIPAAEVAASAKRVGVLATKTTVTSKTFVKELKKVNASIKVFQQAAPPLVPLIEQNKLSETEPLLEKYLQPLLARNIDTLILGCTHYALVADRVRKIVGKGIRVIAQNNIVPAKLKPYLNHHPKIAKRLTEKGTSTLWMTDTNKHYRKTARKWFGSVKQLKKVDIVKGNSKR